jgi:hypothetical protein
VVFLFLIFGGKCVLAARCRGRNCVFCWGGNSSGLLQIHGMLERFSFISLDEDFRIRSANFPEMRAVMYSY